MRTHFCYTHLEDVNLQEVTTKCDEELQTLAKKAGYKPWNNHWAVDDDPSPTNEP